MLRGKFILFEGLDRSGKSTQARKLAEALKERGSRVEQRHYPERSTQVGSAINSYLTKTKSLNDQAIHLLFSANRWELQQALVDLLDSGVTVVVDRYVYSGVAFSSAKGLDREWCWQSDFGLVRPDLTIFLDISPEEASSRGGYGEEIYEKVSFQSKVKAEFALIAAKEEIRSSEAGKASWVSLNAQTSLETLHAQILSHVDAVPDRLPGDYDFMQK
ncbi:hypothetical protein BB561_004528 [Smittium simulii]|uniref:Thymidylate kinase n=1 Tax=Smittium simulii TaxID=133385 RepID=A0A2T9YFT1_9FUNG|nr:hypothetical protein BB561_004528 [Smittium simulii]